MDSHFQVVISAISQGPTSVAKGVGSPAGRSALPDTREGALVSKMNGVEGSECEEVPGRVSDREKRGPGELCFLGDKGCTEVAPPADSRTATGPGFHQVLFFCWELGRQLVQDQSLLQTGERAPRLHGATARDGLCLTPRCTVAVLEHSFHFQV